MCEKNTTGRALAESSLRKQGRKPGGWDENKKVYDIGYCIHKSKWKQGFGSEAVSLLLEWLKANGAEKVTAEVAADNIPSNMLLRKFGFEIEKQTEFKKYNMDVRFDSYIYAKNL